MGPVAIDVEETRRAIETAAAALGALLRSLDDGDDPIDGSAWTVGDTVVHLAADVGTNTASLLGHLPVLEADLPVRTSERLAVLNAKAVKAAVVSAPSALAALVESATAAFLDASDGRKADERLPTPWYGDATSQEVDAMSCIVLGEVIVHGYDIAKATGRPWTIDPRHAALVLCGVADMLPLYVDRRAAAKARATFEVRIRGGQRFAVRVEDGTATVHPSAPSVDCHISADPVSLLLVAYGRKSQWGPILQGKMVAWGRKPWLGLSFRGLFANP